MGSNYELKCPKCDGVIEHDDTYDDSFDENYLINYCVGHCIKCGTEFQWQEELKITFNGVKYFEEVS
jgi:predicted nucleic-acid-binding Zn-ribbon protein